MSASTYTPEHEHLKEAQDYYDSEDAFNFYKEVWGGDNVHVGMYRDAAIQAMPVGPDLVKAGGQHALEKLFTFVPPNASCKIADFGSCYGGCARYAATTFGCKVVCIDLSLKENAYNRELTAAAGLGHLITVKDASFTETGEPAEEFDLVVSEDSILHAGDLRDDVVKEAARLLKPGGHLVFTDIMQSDTADVAKLQPIYDRIHLSSMGSPAAYKRAAKLAGLEFVQFEDHSYTLADHYAYVDKVLLAKKESMGLSDEFVTNMRKGLAMWVDGGNTGQIVWGYWVFRKPLEASSPYTPSHEHLATAQDYYDSDDAFNFYKQVWGGENVHVGLYRGEDVQAIPMGPDHIRAGGDMSLKQLFHYAPPSQGQKIADFGSCYGGCARYAAKTFGCSVVCIDLSLKENSVNREMTENAGLSHLVTVKDTSFTETGEPGGEFDLVVSQDSFLHAGDLRDDVLKEAARLLKPGGHLVFTDIMQSDTADLEALQPIFKRIHLSSMASPSKYKKAAEAAGLVFEQFDDYSYCLQDHYTNVDAVLVSQRETLTLSDTFVTNMRAGLAHWVTAASTGNLLWGYWVFRKA